MVLDTAFLVVDGSYHMVGVPVHVRVCRHETSLARVIEEPLGEDQGPVLDGSCNLVETAAHQAHRNDVEQVLLADLGERIRQGRCQ